MIDIAAVASSALARADELVPAWLPGGKRRGHEWLCGDLTGAPGESTSVNLMTGQWADFAGTQKGGDLVSLYAAIHSISQIDAAKALDDGYKPLNGTHRQPEPAISVQRPANAAFSKSLFRHPKHGLPTSEPWVYRDAEGPLGLVVCRYDVEGGKQIIPWIWTGLKWWCKGHPKPRPLYGLERLAKMPTKPVLLVEGEKTADAAQRLFPGRPCISWPNGAQGHTHVDWGPLHGRKVTLWPDNDAQGRQAMAQIAQRLLGMECTLRIITPDPKREAGWDLADDEAAGTPASALIRYAEENGTAVVVPPRDPVKPDPAPDDSDPFMPPEARPGDAKPPKTRMGLWQSYFQLKTNSTPYLNVTNVKRAVAAMAKEFDFELDLFWNEFTQRVENGLGEWTDMHTAMFQSRLQTDFYLYDIKKTTVGEGITSYAYDHRRNPVKEWLLNLKWDGHERLTKLMPLGFGSKSRQYEKDVGRCFMVGMVARVLKPGCKVDAMPIFEGAQGHGKSKALRALGGDKYFTEVHESIHNKDFYIAITGKMLCEISELHAFSRQDIEKIKGVISNQTDRYRVPFAVHAQDFPRSSVFAGTTNRDDWNTDETGARRFWPIRCGIIDHEWIEVNREQLFAEAVHRFHAHERWWDVDPKGALEQQALRRELDPYEPLVAEYLKHATHLTNLTYIYERVLMLDPYQITQTVARRVGKILRDLGWKRRSVREESGRVIQEWRRDQT